MVWNQDRPLHCFQQPYIARKRATGPGAVADASDLVEFTLLKACVGADRLDDARRVLSGTIAVPG